MRTPRLAIPALSLPWLGFFLNTQALAYPIGKLQAVVGSEIVASDLQRGDLEPQDHFQPVDQMQVFAGISKNEVYSA